MVSQYEHTVLNKWNIHHVTLIYVHILNTALQ